MRITDDDLAEIAGLGQKPLTTGSFTAPSNDLAQVAGPFTHPADQTAPQAFQRLWNEYQPPRPTVSPVQALEAQARGIAAPVPTFSEYEPLYRQYSDRHALINKYQRMQLSPDTVRTIVEAEKRKELEKDLKAEAKKLKADLPPEYGSFVDQIVATEVPERWSLRIEEEIRRRAELKADEQRAAFDAELDRQTKGLTDPAQAESVAQMTANIERAKMGGDVPPDELSRMIEDRTKAQMLPTDTGELYSDQVVDRGGAFVRNAAQSLVPSATAGAAGFAAMALTTNPWLKLALAMGAGIAGSMAAGKTQDAVLSNVLPEGEYEKWQAQLADDRAKYPLTSFMGDLSTGLVAGKINPVELKTALGATRALMSGRKVAGLSAAQKSALLNSAFGAGMGGGQEFARQALEEGDWRPLEIAAATIINSVINDTRFGKPFADAVAVKSNPDNAAYVKGQDDLDAAALKAIKAYEDGMDKARATRAKQPEPVIEPTPIEQPVENLVQEPTISARVVEPEPAIDNPVSTPITDADLAEIASLKRADVAPASRAEPVAEQSVTAGVSPVRSPDISPSRLPAETPGESVRSKDEIAAELEAEIADVPYKQQRAILTEKAKAAGVPTKGTNADLIDRIAAAQAPEPVAVAPKQPVAAEVAKPEQKPVQPESVTPAAPEPKPLRTGTDAVNKSAKVTVAAPDGATFVRVTNAKGQVSIMPIAEVNKGANSFIGSGAVKVDAGIRTKDGKFKPVEGEVTVTERIPPKRIFDDAPVASKDAKAKQEGGFVDTSPIGRLIKKAKAAFSTTGGVAKEAFSRIEDMRVKFAAGREQGRIDSEIIRRATKTAEKAGKVNEPLRAIREIFTGRAQSVRVNGKDYTDVDLEKLPYQDVRKIAQSVGVDTKTITTRDGMIDEVMLTAPRETLDTFAQKHGLSKTDELYTDMKSVIDEAGKRSQELADELERAGSDPALVKRIRSNPYYEPRIYRAYIEGESFVPKKENVEEAEGLARASIVRQIDDIATRSTELRKAGADMKRYLETGDTAALANLSPEMKAAAQAVGSVFERNRQLVDIDQTADTVTLRKKAAKLDDAAKSVVSYYLERATSQNDHAAATGVGVIDNLSERSLRGVYRALYGEEKDLRVTMRRRAEIQTANIARLQLMDRLYAEGKDKWWSELKQDAEGFTKKLGSGSVADGVSAYDRKRFGIMAGRYVTQEMHDLLTGGDPSRWDFITNNPLSSLQGFQRNVRVSSVPRNWLRDTGSNYFSWAMQTGDALEKEFWKGAAHANGILMRLARSGGRDVQARRDLQRIIKLGAFDPRETSILEQMADDLAGPYGNPLKKMADVLAKGRSFLDFAPKYGMYLAAEARAKRMGRTDAHAYALEHVRSLAQNYSRVPKFFKTAQKVPIFGPDYLNYRVNATISQIAAFKHAAQMAKNGRGLDKIKPALGFALARTWPLLKYSGAYTAMATAADAWLKGRGVKDAKPLDEEREKALRYIQPEYFRNEVQYPYEYTDKNGKKTIGYMVLGGGAVTAFPLDELLFGLADSGDYSPANVGRHVLRFAWDWPMMTATIWEWATGDRLGTPYSSGQGVIDALGSKGSAEWKLNIIKDRTFDAAVDLLALSPVDMMYRLSTAEDRKRERVESVTNLGKLRGVDEPYERTKTARDMTAQKFSPAVMEHLAETDIQYALKARMRDYSTVLRSEKSKLKSPDPATKAAAEREVARIGEKVEEWKRNAKILLPAISDNALDAILKDAGIRL